MVAVDLDGTLLNQKMQITEQTRRAVQRASAHGIEVVFCTGRTLVELDDAMQALPEVRYAISSSGASVRDLHTGQSLCSRCFTPQSGRLLVERLLQFDGMIAVFAGIHAYISEAWRTRIFDVFPPQLAQYNARYYTPIPDLLTYASGTYGAVEKIFGIFVSHEERERAWDCVRNFTCEQAVSSPENLELNATGATKGAALAWLVQHLGLKRDEVMAIGDSCNDRTMLEYAGVPAIVANADPQIHSLARCILPSNEENGVAWALDRLLDGATF